MTLLRFQRESALILENIDSVGSGVDVCSHDSVCSSLQTHNWQSELTIWA